MSAITSVAADRILYDYTTSVQNSSNIGSSELGEIVFLDHPSILTKLAIVMRGGGLSGALDDLKVRFYSTTTTNPNSAAPGDLFSSWVAEDLYFTSDIELFEITLPRIKVPSAFFFTVEPVNGTSLSKYWGSDGFPGHIGTNGRKYRRSGTGWLPLGLGDDLAVRFEGFPVPEPSGLVVAVLMLAICFTYSRRRL